MILLTFLKGYTCDLTKTFIRIFGLIFLKISGTAAALQSLSTSRSWLWHICTWYSSQSYKNTSLHYNLNPYYWNVKHCHWRSEVLTAVLLRIQVFWDVTPCWWMSHSRYSTQTYCFYLQVSSSGIWTAWPYVWGQRSFETSGNHRQRSSLEDLRFQQHRSYSLFGSRYVDWVCFSNHN